jgi:hypothetical protein
VPKHRQKIGNFTDDSLAGDGIYGARIWYSGLIKLEIRQPNRCCDGERNLDRSVTLYQLGPESGNSELGCRFGEEVSGSEICMGYGDVL